MENTKKAEELSRLNYTTMICALAGAGFEAAADFIGLGLPGRMIANGLLNGGSNVWGADHMLNQVVGNPKAVQILVAKAEAKAAKEKAVKDAKEAPAEMAPAEMAPAEMVPAVVADATPAVIAPVAGIPPEVMQALTGLAAATLQNQNLLSCAFAPMIEEARLHQAERAEKATKDAEKAAEKAAKDAEKAAKDAAELAAAQAWSVAQWKKAMKAEEKTGKAA